MGLSPLRVACRFTTSAAAKGLRSNKALGSTRVVAACLILS
jgi:hypothetical protein